MSIWAMVGLMGIVVGGVAGVWYLAWAIVEAASGRPDTLAACVIGAVAFLLGIELSRRWAPR